MKVIKIKTDWMEFDALQRLIQQFVPSGEAVSSLLMTSILRDLHPKIQLRAMSWKRMNAKKRTITLRNHEARSIAVFLTGCIGKEYITNPHDLACLDMLRANLIKQLA